MTAVQTPTIRRVTKAEQRREQRAEKRRLLRIEQQRNVTLPPASYNIGSRACPDCGRYTPVLRSGLFRRHRPVADTFAGPYCLAGIR